MYQVIVEQVKHSWWSGFKFRKVLDFATDDFAAAAAEMSKYDSERYRVVFIDSHGELGTTPDFIDHGDTPKPPPEREMLDQELVDEINAQYGEVPF